MSWLVSIIMMIFLSKMNYGHSFSHVDFFFSWWYTPFCDKNEINRECKAQSMQPINCLHICLLWTLRIMTRWLAFDFEDGSTSYIEIHLILTLYIGEDGKVDGMGWWFRWRIWFPMESKVCSSIFPFVSHCIYIKLMLSVWSIAIFGAKIPALALAAFTVVSSYPCIVIWIVRQRITPPINRLI